ncbi:MULTISPECIES: hypothetical protein [unclassified Streptomyces]|uniref:hypothetical protein n=1 Tax=unclassified Streptomyces TaxID=2593676 RepID=UPI00381D2A09
MGAQCPAGRGRLSATTAAGITLISKADGTSAKMSFTAADVAPIMRAIRAEVETPPGHLTDRTSPS